MGEGGGGGDLTAKGDEAKRIGLVKAERGRAGSLGVGSLLLV